MRKVSKIFFLFIALSILVLSLIPVPQVEFVQFSDKITHIIAYGLLACFFVFAFSSGNIHFRLLSLISITACTFYGGIIEILQSFVQRSPEFMDLVADFTGSVIGTIIATIVMFIRKHYRPGHDRKS
ncbi:MAG: VanZ family protein [Spirochaetales bacterium]|nr:VanZ family protein [Spirochaetales bacterium]